MKNGNPQGLINVRVRIHTADNRMVYDQNRNFSVHKDPLKLSIPLKQLSQDHYDLWVEVLDLQVGRSTLKHHHIDLTRQPEKGG